MRRSTPIFATILLLAGTSAIAQTRHDSTAPINFDAAHIELQDKAHRAVLTGSVVVVQAEMTLKAARMTVAYAGKIDERPQASRIDASGNVVVIRPNQTARSNYGIYDVNSRVVTMLGAVTLTQGGNTVKGGRLTLDLDTGHAVIDGSSVAGGTTGGAAGGVVTQASGRVSGTFSVPKRAN